MTSPGRDGSNAASCLINGPKLAKRWKFDLAQKLVFSAELQSCSRKSTIFEMVLFFSSSLEKLSWWFLFVLGLWQRPRVKKSGRLGPSHLWENKLLEFRMPIFPRTNLLFYTWGHEFDRGFWSWNAKGPPSAIQMGHFCDADHFLESLGGPHGRELWPKLKWWFQGKQTVPQDWCF